jgi:hypothetical protein
MSRDQSLTADLSRGRDCLYLGAAGEHWVAANLLRAGFNANVLPEAPRVPRRLDYVEATSIVAAS